MINWSEVMHQLGSTKKPASRTINEVISFSATSFRMKTGAYLLPRDSFMIVLTIFSDASFSASESFTVVVIVIPEIHPSPAPL